MKFVAAFAVLTAIFGRGALASSYGGKKSPTHLNTGCIMAHCPLSFAKAALNPDFKKLQSCETGCNPMYYNDTSYDKVHYQNCTTKCALTYESPAGNAFMSCAMNNKCITFDPINATCPKPEVDSNSSLASLSGEWWQHYGKNALWDCYPCQHIHAMESVDNADWCAQTKGPKGPVAAPCWSYNYSYDLYTETSRKYFGQVWQLPGDVPMGEPIDIYYVYMGTTHNETWYILKATERYVLLVDCSYMNGWTNVGSIVWVRPNVVLTKIEIANIAQVYQEKMGWDFPTDFCADRHGPELCNAPGYGPTSSLRRRPSKFIIN